VLLQKHELAREACWCSVGVEGELEVLRLKLSMIERTREASEKQGLLSD
jgi:hypothetical protein